MARGKTTTLRILLGLVDATAGTALVFGERYRDLSARISTVGSLLDASRFHPGRRVLDELAIHAAAAGGLPAHLRRSGYSRARAGRRGWDYCHVAIDDTSRIAYVEILDDERAATCAGFLRRAVAWFAGHGVIVQRVMTDNGPGYRSHLHDACVAELGIRHLRTKPYRPCTNGKAERFIQTLQVEWAYAASYQYHHHRAAALAPWLEYYNCRRPHSALGHKTPASIIGPD